MLPLLLLLSGVDDVMVAYRDRTAAEKACKVDPNATDVTVCGLRRADRFRVPFVGPTPGDPAIQNVPAERAALLHRTSPVQELSPFLVGGGFTGAHFSSRTGFGAGQTAERKPAP